MSHEDDTYSWELLFEISNVRIHISFALKANLKFAASYSLAT